MQYTPSPYDKLGTLPRDIHQGETYELLVDENGTTLPLGKCIKNEISIGGHPLDTIIHRSLEFEKNNDHPLLQKELVNVDWKINIRKST
jgi:hypothetical protein